MSSLGGSKGRTLDGNTIPGLFGRFDSGGDHTTALTLFVTAVAGFACWDRSKFVCFRRDDPAVVTSRRNDRAWAVGEQKKDETTTKTTATNAIDEDS